MQHMLALDDIAPGQPGKPHIATAPADKPPPVGSGNPPAYPDGQWTAGLSKIGFVTDPEPAKP
mgnify:CR=1 FL=1